ncbi:MAG: hypothetical protein AAFY71_20820 [Bacteroidota bacterium]
MSERSISLDDLISYFEGNASKSLEEEILRQREKDEEFAEEMEDWEYHIKEDGNPSAVIAQLKAFKEVWHDTKPHEAKKVKPLFPRWTPIAVAAAIAIFLASSVALQGLLRGDGLDLDAQLASDMNQKIGLLIGPEAGIDSQKDKAVEWERMIREANAKSDMNTALAMVDSLIGLFPEDHSYQLLKGLLLEKYQKSPAAILQLEKVSELAGEDLSVSCESKWYLILIHAKQKQNAKALESVNSWENGRCAELDQERAKQLKEMRKLLE